MDAIYVLYDFDLEAAYDVDQFDSAPVVAANTEFQRSGASVRWIPYAEFREMRKHYIIAIVAKDGEFCTSKLMFRSRADAEETATKLGGTVREMVIF